MPDEQRKDEHLGLRIDPQLSERIQVQVERENAARPGLGLSRSVMVRVLVNEALDAREGKKRR